MNFTKTEKELLIDALKNKRNEYAGHLDKPDYLTKQEEKDTAEKIKSINNLISKLNGPKLKVNRKFSKLKNNKSFFQNWDEVIKKL